MEKLQWFKFAPMDWAMGKIKKCPELTRSRFIDLICLYWNKECVLEVEDAEIEIDKEHLDILISKKIIKVAGIYIQIEFLDAQFLEICNTSKKRSIAVKQRWEREKQKPASEVQTDTSVLQDDTSVLQNDTDKSRVELDKTTTTIKDADVVDFRNESQIQKEIQGHPTGLSRHDMFMAQSLQDEVWKESLYMKRVLKPETIDAAIRDYNIHLIQHSENKNSLKDYKSHFVNWVNKKREIHQKSTAGKL